MPNKALLNGMPVFADTVAGTGAFICTECATGMYYKRAGKQSLTPPVSSGSAARSAGKPDGNAAPIWPSVASSRQAAKSGKAHGRTILISNGSSNAAEPYKTKC